MAARGGQTRIGGIVIDILGSSVGFQKELKEADRAAARFAANFSKQWKTTTAGLEKSASAVLNLKTAVLGLAGAAGVGALVRNTLEYADAVSDASDALGLNTKAYQELSFAASQAGLRQEKFTSSFSKFVQLAEDYAQGDKSDAFTRLGISAQEAGGNVEALFNLVVQQLDQLPTDNERLKVLGELFGKKVATQWAATLSGGAQGLAAMRAEADRLGLVLEDKQVRALGQLADQVDAIGTKFKIAFATGLIEGLTGKTGEMADLLKDPEIGQALNELADGFRTLATEVGRLPERVRALADELQGLQQYEGIAKIVAAGFAGGKAGSLIGGSVAGKKGSSRGALLGFGIGAAAEAYRQQANEDVDNIRRFQAWRAAQMYPGAEDVGPVYPGLIGVPPLLARPEATATAPVTDRALGATGTQTAAADKAAKDAARAQAQIDQFVASLKAEVDGLEMEAAAMGLSAQAQQEAAIQKELLNTLTDRHIQLGTVEADQVEELIRRKAQLGNDRAATELLQNLDAEIAAAREQVGQLGLLTQARVREQVIAQAQAEARSKGIILSEKEIAQIQERADLIGKLADLQERAESTRQSFEDAASILGAGFSDAIINGEKLSDVIDNIGASLLQLALQRMVIDPFVSAAGNVGSALVRGLSGAAGTAGAASVAAPAAAAAAFNVDDAAAAVGANNVGSAPEVNVFVQSPEGTRARTESKPNGTGGVDVAILVEQIEQQINQNTLRGRGLMPTFKALGVARTAMSG